MKLLTFVYKDRKHAGVLTEKGVAPIEGATDLLEIIRAGTIPQPSSTVLPNGPPLRSSSAGCA